MIKMNNKTTIISVIVVMILLIGVGFFAENKAEEIWEERCKSLGGEMIDYGNRCFVKVGDEMKSYQIWKSNGVYGFRNRTD